MLSFRTRYIIAALISLFIGIFFFALTSNKIILISSIIIGLWLILLGIFNKKEKHLLYSSSWSNFEIIKLIIIVIILQFVYYYFFDKVFSIFDILGGVFALLLIYIWLRFLIPRLAALG